MVRPVRVLLFATARTAVGRGELEWPVPPSGATARDLVAALSRKYPALAPVARTSRFVRNGRYLERMGERVRPGDEFAVHPPYGGG
ncbi:MAG TPA: MoaD/ThiS family protein [Thermoplasmata archaeon]|nr:MoaD/ThiS family protein [Thermoplasmata archaeon]